MSSTYTEKWKEITEEKGVIERLCEWQTDGWMLAYFTFSDQIRLSSLVCLLILQVYKHILLYNTIIQAPSCLGKMQEPRNSISSMIKD